MRPRRARAASTAFLRRSSYAAVSRAACSSSSRLASSSFVRVASSSPSVREANIRAWRSRPDAAATVPASAAASNRNSTCAPAMRSLADASTSTSPRSVSYSSLGSFSIARRSASASVSNLKPSLLSFVLTQSYSFWKKVGSACIASSASSGLASSASIVALKMSTADEPCSFKSCSRPSGVDNNALSFSLDPVVVASSPKALRCAAAQTLGAACCKRCMVSFHRSWPSLERNTPWNAS